MSQFVEEHAIFAPPDPNADTLTESSAESAADNGTRASSVPPLELSVIIPARDEQDALPGCLTSLIAQSEPGFALGVEWELIIVDDHSSDLTRTLAETVAERFPSGVFVLKAPELEDTERGGFTGKNAACWAGAQHARGKLLLFTDADTIHEPGDLARARRELEKYEVALLSYSPRQLTSGLLQRLIMPLVFAELAKAYPIKRVNTPGDRTAAANGQFVMVTEEAYFAVGGHRGVGVEILEDVALATRIKQGRRTIRLRYAPDALSTRMYRTNDAMVEGWTKNLALLFTTPVPMAVLSLLVFGLAIVLPCVALFYPFLTTLQRALIGVVWLRGVWHFYARVGRSNFSALDCALSVLGLPFFAWLLVRSYLQVKVRKRVEWKGRLYRAR